eukprot:6168273-Amphidinium_carterae.1
MNALTESTVYWVLDAFRTSTYSVLVENGPSLSLGTATAIFTDLCRRLKADYDYNICYPGSRIKNPDPENYNDVSA